jgi:hypothetical protein
MIHAGNMSGIGQIYFFYLNSRLIIKEVEVKINILQNPT